MSADLLREAAAKMRERAQAATPGAWEAYRRHGSFLDAPDRIGVCAEDAGDISPDIFEDVGCSAKNATHVASWHPLVALAVADWLDSEADRYERHERLWRIGSRDPRNRWEERGLTVEGNLEHHFKHALTVARAYLGRES